MLLRVILGRYPVFGVTPVHISATASFRRRRYHSVSAESSAVLTIRLSAPMRAAHVPVTLNVLCAASVLHSGAVWGQALPQPPEIVAKPAYVALVRAMKEDEVLLRILRRQIESEKHRYKAECVANLRPGLVTTTIAWAMEPAISAQEVADATRFFESEAGRNEAERDRFMKTEAGNKLLVRSITRQPRVLVSLRAEVLDLLNICTDTLEGTRQITYCESNWVRSADEACSARYEVSGRAGDAARVTRVSLYCDFRGSDLSSLLTELPGAHETVGLSWPGSRTLEVLLPASVTPRYRQTGDPARALKYEYHTRKPDDPPAAACVATPPIDEFGWPAR